MVKKIAGVPIPIIKHVPYRRGRDVINLYMDIHTHTLCTVLLHRRLHLIEKSGVKAINLQFNGLLLLQVRISLLF